MPDDFPVDELTKFMAVARRVLLEPDMSAAWKEFAGASNLIGWRFRGSSDYWLEYKQSLVASSDSGGHEEQFRRERALFGMFSAGVSCIESTTYALAALASHPRVLSLSFGPGEQRACSPRKLADWLAPYAAARQLTVVLNGLLVSTEWSLWVDLRNRMTHRSNLPRMIFASAGAPAPVVAPINFAQTSSTRRVEAEISDFDALHKWLARSLGSLLAEGRQLVNLP
jgi:hypothetical protein